MQPTRRQASLIRKIQAAMSRLDESRLRDAHTTGTIRVVTAIMTGRLEGRQTPELRSAIPPRRRVT
jgi:hypothetical protein